jgi:hypothetical protein
MNTTTMEIKLSNVASAVLDVMATHSGVTAEAIGRVCVELTLAQAIDRSICEEGEEWYVDAATTAPRACRKAWKEVDKPGFIYRKAVAAALNGQASLIREDDKRPSRHKSVEVRAEIRGLHSRVRILRKAVNAAESDISQLEAA